MVTKPHMFRPIFCRIDFPYESYFVAARAYFFARDPDRKMGEETQRQQIFVRVAGTLIAAGVIGAVKVLVWDGRWTEVWASILANPRTSGAILLVALLLIAFRWVGRRKQKRAATNSSPAASDLVAPVSTQVPPALTPKMAKKQAKMELKKLKKGD